MTSSAVAESTIHVPWLRRESGRSRRKTSTARVPVRALLSSVPLWRQTSRARHQTVTRSLEQNRGRINAARRKPPAKLRCVECGGEFEGRKGKLLCSRRCKDRRYARLHPEAVRAKQRRKDELAAPP